MTGFRTFGEFIAETNPYERQLIASSIEAYQRKQQGGGSAGGASTPGGMGGGF